MDHHFDNLDALKAAIAERALDRIHPLLESSTSTAAPHGPLIDCVDALIASRLAFFESIAEIVHVASVNHGSNAADAPNIAAVRDLFREQVVGIFSLELAAVVDGTVELRITAITKIISVPTIDFLFTAATHTTEELSVVVRLRLLAVITAPSLKPRALSPELARRHVGEEGSIPSPEWRTRNQSFCRGTADEFR